MRLTLALKASRCAELASAALALVQPHGPLARLKRDPLHYTFAADPARFRVVGTSAIQIAANA
ncbi:MAG TPA: hypothetical protein VNG89_07120 [Vicinamibacterales bacterium]|nr:hypothetical protein [Vicinamibacterales bacterium]